MKLKKDAFLKIDVLISWAHLAIWVNLIFCMTCKSFASPDMTQTHPKYRAHFPEGVLLTELLGQVALDLKLNLIWDNSIREKVQIIAPELLSANDYLEIIHQLLEITGYTAIKIIDGYKIIPSTNAVQNLANLDQKGTTKQGILTRVLRPIHIQARELRLQIAQLLKLNSVMLNEQANSLIITDYASTIKKIEVIMEVLDTEQGRHDLSLFTVQHYPAKQVLEHLQTYLRLLQSSRSVKTLTSNTPSGVAIVMDEASNYIGIYGAVDMRNKLIREAKRFDQPIDYENNHAKKIRLKALNYIDADKISNALAQLSSQTSGPYNFSPTHEQTLKITPDDQHNTLLIDSNYQDFLDVSKVIDKLDRPRQQIMFEVKILSLQFQNSFEIKSSIISGARGNKQNIFTTFRPRQVMPFALKQSNQSNTEAATQLAVDSISTGLKIGLFAKDGIDILGIGKLSPTAFMDFLREDGLLRDIQTPILLCQEGHESSLVVGEKVFFITADQETVSAQLGMELVIRPLVAQHDSIQVEIELESHSLNGVIASGMPLLANRKIRQNITVPNDQYMVLAGLKQKINFETKSSVPILGDIPLLGWLFQSITKKDKEGEILILMKAVKMKDPKALSNWSKEHAERHVDERLLQSLSLQGIEPTL